MDLCMSVLWRGESVVMLSFPLHLSMAQNEAGVSTGQQSGNSKSRGTA